MKLKDFHVQKELITGNGQTFEGLLYVLTSSKAQQTFTGIISEIASNLH